MKTKDEIENDLQYFYGSETWYRHQADMLYTEGVKFLADKCQCYWLIDLVYSYQHREKFSIEPFQVWEVKVDLEAQTAVVTATDGNDHLLAKQVIPYTDFPLEYIKLYYTESEDWVLMLPSEY